MDEVGTTDNAAGSESGPSTGAVSSGNISSGTASEAMIKAATAASSADATADAPVKGTPVPTGAADANGASGSKPVATGQPAVEKVAPIPTGAESGPVPLDRHTRAVENARQAGSNEALKTYAWAAGFTKDDVADLNGALRLVRDLRKDPTAFAHNLNKELGLTAAAPAETKPEAFSLPEPELATQDGKRVAYSAAQVTTILEGFKTSLMAEMRKELNPLSEFVTTEQKTRESQEEQRNTQALRDQVMGDARALPHFKDHEQAIHDKLKGMVERDPRRVERIGAVAALYEAYHGVLNETVYPSLTATADQRVRDENARKVAASTGSVHPSRSSSAAGAKPKLDNPTDLARHMSEMAAKMTGATA